jgi:hypothetical protein
MRIIFFAVLVVCASCTTPAVIVKKNVNIQRLGIYFDTSDQTFDLIGDRVESDLDLYIKNYNATPGHKFVLYRASAADSSSIRVKILTTQLVSPGQQAAGVFVTMAGLSLPFVMVSAGAPIYVFFYYFPRVKSVAELSLSPDIQGQANSRKEVILSSPGFLLPPDKQVQRHVIFLNQFLSRMVSQIEKQTARSKPSSYASH